jgi:hypothetical protein
MTYMQNQLDQGDLSCTRRGEQGVEGDHTMHRFSGNNCEKAAIKSADLHQGPTPTTRSHLPEHSTPSPSKPTGQFAHRKPEGLASVAFRVHFPLWKHGELLAQTSMSALQTNTVNIPTGRARREPVTQIAAYIDKGCHKSRSCRCRWCELHTTCRDRRSGTG